MLEEGDLHEHQRSARHRVEVLDAAAGAAAGAVAGIFAGPIGAAAGAVVGAAIGAVVGHALEQNEDERAKRNTHLDDIGRDDPVALSRRWASEMPDELYVEGMDDSLEPGPIVASEEEPASEGAEAPDTGGSSLAAVMAGGAPELRQPSIPIVEPEEVDEELQRYIVAVDRRATLAGRVLVSEPPPEVETSSLPPDAVDDELRARGAKPNKPVD
jgi:hypothetical protein